MNKLLLTLTAGAALSLPAAAQKIGSAWQVARDVTLGYTGFNNQVSHYQGSFSIPAPPDNRQIRIEHVGISANTPKGVNLYCFISFLPPGSQQSGGLRFNTSAASVSDTMDYKYASTPTTLYLVDGVNVVSCFYTGNAAPIAQVRLTLIGRWEEK